jgi:hypothetical protein
MADQQILGSGSKAAPLDYTVPSNGLLQLKAVQALFTDNGAASDWLPAVVLISDSGDVIARAVDPNVKVTAGDDAEVSWFPGVKPSSASAVLQSRGTRLYTVTGQVVASGAATEIQPDAGGPLPYAGMRPLEYLFGTRFNTFKVSADRAFISIVVKWPAGAYDRYIEIVDPSFFTSSAALSYRVRGGATPDDDIQYVTAQIDGSYTTPVSVGFNCYQASGVDQTISSWIVADEWPILNPPLVWS